MWNIAPNIIKNINENTICDADNKSGKLNLYE